MINARRKIRDESPEPEDEQGPPFLRQGSQEGPARRTSRLLDILIASLLLVFTSPLLLFVALLIKWESRGPVLEKRSCTGEGGRRFEMLNFRTSEYEQRRVGWARNITRVGEFLRYTRIEGLPQLINVLRGEMSILRMDEHPPY
jgi:lipopolysaccharide/colanic/teichoic acid biosynthesis glycosyltransferase